MVPEAPTSTSSELISTGFPPVAKLILLCSPLFVSLPHAWRMLALQSLSELRPDLRLDDMYHYLSVEIIFSIMATPVALLADASIGLKTTMLSFMLVSCIPPLLGSVASLPGFATMTRICMLKAAAGFTGLGVVVSVLERAFFVSLMNVNSPSFRLYCFFCLYLSIVWQIVNSIVLTVPKLFPYLSGEHKSMAWIMLAYQCALWSYMMIMYIAIAHFTSEYNPGGDSFKVIVCMYMATFYALKMIWARLRWKDLHYTDVFEGCEQWYPKKVVIKTKQTFKLFMVIMCLMYLFGMELILRSIWFHQDDILSKYLEPTIMKVISLDMLLLVYLAILYPVVNFLLIPFIRKTLYLRLSDLRLVGVSLILYNLSYIATMALEWAVLSASVSSPHTSNVAIRVYNCMINPVAWTVRNPDMTPVTIFLPARMSRMFINDVEGTYDILLNSTVYSYATSLKMETGRARVFLMRGGEVEHFTDMERQLSAVPDHYDDRSHLFVINGLLNTTNEYLSEKHVEVSWRNEDGSTKSTQITVDFTHLIFKKAAYKFTLKLGQTKFHFDIEMSDHGVYSLMFYDSRNGTNEGYEFDTVSIGFVYSRAWANVQLVLLALGMSIGQIPMIHYTYKNSPPDLLATCFSFQRCACATSTFLVWFITSRYGLGPGPSTISTMLVILFTVFFIFLSVSDIIQSNDDRINRVDSGDDLVSNSGSLRFMKSVFDIVPPAPNEQRESKTQFSDRARLSLDKGKR